MQDLTEILSTQSARKASEKTNKQKVETQLPVGSSRQQKSSPVQYNLPGRAPLETPHLRKQLRSSDRSIGSVGIIAVPSSPQGLTASSHCWKGTFLTDHFDRPPCIKWDKSTTSPWTETASSSQCNSELSLDRGKENFYLKSKALALFSGFLLFLVYLKVSFALFLTLLTRGFSSCSFFLLLYISCSSQFLTYLYSFHSGHRTTLLHLKAYIP